MMLDAYMVLKQESAGGANDFNEECRADHGSRSQTDGIPPSLFWESDVGKW